MLHVQQPAGSNQCGQACISMLSEISLPEVVKMMGKTGRTRTTDLVHAIRTGRGWMLAMRCPDRLIKVHREYQVLPRNCIVKACSPDRKRSHWMLVYDGAIHDPECCECAPHKDICNWEITSYLPLSGGTCHE